MVRALAVVVVLVSVASCKELNPGSCAVNPGVCKAGSTCVTGKDGKGREWSLCVPVDAGDELPDAGPAPLADGPTLVADGPALVDVAGADAAPAPDTSSPPPPDAGRDAIVVVDTRPPAPDLVPDVAILPDGPTCMNQCTAATSRCGGNGGTQACVVAAGGCTAYAAEVACQAPRSCVLNGTSASCECPSTCTAGAKRCGSQPDRIEECLAGAGGCVAWTEKACGAGQKCIANACVTCPKQSPANIVPNGGFDENLGGWGGDLGGEDASGCPVSRSLLLVATPGDNGSILIGQSYSPCFSMVGSQRYSFGAAFRRSAGSKVSCFVLTWPDAGACAAGSDGSGGTRLESIDDGLAQLNQWTRAATELDALPAAVSARVNCRTDGKGYVDEVYLAPAPGGF